MKKTELPCAVVEDLLPAYLEGLTSAETNAAVEDHLASCPACAAKRAAMGGGDDAAQAEQAETAREVDYLKKVRRRNRKRVAAAILCTVLVLLLGFTAKIFVIGTPLNPDGVGVSVQREDDVLRVDISSVGSGNAFHGWKVQDEDGIVTITARSVLVSPLFRDGTGTVEVPLEGVTEVWLGQAGEGRLIWQEDTEISPDAWMLYQAQTPYVGDNSAVGRALAAVDTWYGPPIVDYTISLQTSSEPYGLTIHFDSVTAYTPGAADTINERMRILAPVLLALVGNLEEVRWTYTGEDGVAVTHAMALERADAALPNWVEAYNTVRGMDLPALESIKDYAASPAAMQQLLDLALFGFYGIGESGNLTSFGWVDDLPAEQPTFVS